jgi:CRP-like cAMP-binding protein
MENSPTISDAIASKVSEGHLRKIALKEGMNTLRQDGLLKCQQGMTTLDQVLEKTVIQKESLPHYLLNPDEMIFENGDTIIKEGNTDTAFYKLIQGCLEVFKGQNNIAEISQTNTYFGEMSALVGSRRSATIRSKGRSIVKVFPGDKLGEVLENYPDISKQIIDTLVLRLNESGNRLSEMMQNRIELERTYVNQLTSTVGAASNLPVSSRPIAAAPKHGLQPGVASASKPSAQARLAARKAGGQFSADGGGTALKPGNGAGNGQPIIRPVPKTSQPFNNTVMASPAIQAGKPISADSASRTVIAPIRETPARQPAMTAIPVEIEASPIQTVGPVSRTAPDMTSRRGLARVLAPADQTQMLVMTRTGPPAKILRDVR